MAVMIGRDAKVSLGSSGAASSALGVGTWTLSQPGPALLDATVFGDDWVKNESGVRDGGTISFSGNFDYAKLMQKKLQTDFNAGTALTTASSFRLYMSTGVTGSSASHGYFRLAPLTVGAKLIITSFNASQDKAGLGQIDFSMKISGGYMGYTTST